MKRIAFLVLLACACVLFAASSTTLAAHPHFVTATAAGPDAAAALAVNFKEAGLGNAENTTYVASADVTLTEACVDTVGVITTATIVNDTVSATITSPNNGQNTLTLTLTPPTLKITCKATEIAVIANIGYSNVKIADTTNAVTQSIPGFFYRAFF